MSCHGHGDGIESTSYPAAPSPWHPAWAPICERWAISRGGRVPTSGRSGGQSQIFSGFPLPTQDHSRRLAPQSNLAPAALNLIRHFSHRQGRWRSASQNYFSFSFWHSSSDSRHQTAENALPTHPTECLMSPWEICYQIHHQPSSSYCAPPSSRNWLPLFRPQMTLGGFIGGSVVSAT